jgi:two-component system response regulator DesR
MAAHTHGRGAIRVFLVCDDPAARAKRGAALLGYGDIDVVGDCSSGSQALEQIQAAAADVAVLDCDLRGEQIAELCRSLKAFRASIGVLLMSAMRRPPLRLAIDIADGLMLRSTPVAALAQGIRDAHRGRPAMDRRLWPALFDDEFAC